MQLLAVLCIAKTGLNLINSMLKWVKSFIPLGFREQLTLSRRGDAFIAPLLG